MLAQLLENLEGVLVSWMEDDKQAMVDDLRPTTSFLADDVVTKRPTE